MSTAAHPGATIPGSIEKPLQPIPGTLAGNAADGKADLTIHRISKTHHGRTLLLLGHAAEHLANSQHFSVQQSDAEGTAEAIHLLMALSRAVFDDFAQENTPSRRLEHWVLGRVAEIIESRRNRKGAHPRQEPSLITC